MAPVKKLQQLDIQLVVMGGRFTTIVTEELFQPYANAVINTTPPSSPPSAERAASASMSTRRLWPTG